jgi:hypothetical protein
LLLVGSRLPLLGAGIDDVFAVFLGFIASVTNPDRRG